ncbi:MAG: HAMP domain-containing histidine kinase [Acidobacteria bacterium]|nr:HAMP domain-containing histidine kinase [Acidobacteriota bacterium]
MTIFRRRLESGWGSVFITSFLVLGLLLVAVLARLAYGASRSHRRVAEGVLTDYASLAAHELVRRAANEIGYNGCYPIITALRRVAAAPAGGALPEPSALAAPDDEALRRALTLAPSLFVLDAARNALAVSGAPLDAETLAWIRASLPAVAAAKPDLARSFTAARAKIGGRPRAFVIASAGPALVGFELEQGALRGFIDRAVTRGPLLPASLGDGHLTNDLLDVGVVDGEGGDLFRSGQGRGGILRARVPFGDAYGGVLEGAVAVVSIDPAAAPRLVIGGLPESQVPLLLALQGVAAGLVVAAIFLMARERALAAARAEFIARVSHELRTPLTQIRMFAETLLLDRARTDAERRRSLEIIDQEARRLGDLVENVLRFSRGERGDIHLAPRPRAVAPLVREIVSSFLPLARGRGVQVETRLDDAAVASLDDDAMRQVLINLLDNAVKYGPTGQRVVVGAERGGAGVRVWVEDEGPGVPEADRGRIWNRFERLARDRDRAVAGTGIGLTVVRDLVALHGGRAWVEPASGGGARFVVELPA